MRIRIIGVPSAWGTRELGTQHTPRLLRRAGLPDWLAGAGLEVIDAGDLSIVPMGRSDLPPAAPDTTGAAPAHVDPLHVAHVAGVARAVREAVAESLEEGDLPVVLGGECCLSIGVIPALAQSRGSVTVAWMDAHGDLNTPSTSTSGLVTGMPLAVALGHGDAALTAIGADTARPRGNKTFLVGGRELEAGEIRNLSAFGLRHLDTESTRAAGPEEVTMQILDVPEICVMPPEARQQLVAVDPSAAEAAERRCAADVYLHFDVDVLDPEFGPGVAYPVAGGFDPSEIGTLAGYLCVSGRIGAITVASANLDCDVDGRTVAAIRHVLCSVADALAALDCC